MSRLDHLVEWTRGDNCTFVIIALSVIYMAFVAYVLVWA